MRWWVIVIGLIGLLLIGWQLRYALLIGLEKPSYVVIGKKDGYEIRQYKDYLTAQVFASGSYDEASNEGFKILANYIFGENSENKSMPMTAPVFMQEKNKGYKVAFVMPSEYSMSTLPKPRDKRIIIKKVSGKKVAAYRFTWCATKKRVEKRENEFVRLLDRDDIKTRSEVQLARYNPPFILPFLMRNELLVDISGS